MKKPPEKIYLQFDPEPETGIDGTDICPGDVTWSAERIYPNDVEYHRGKVVWYDADKYVPPSDPHDIKYSIDVHSDCGREVSFSFRNNHWVDMDINADDTPIKIKKWRYPDPLKRSNKQ